MQNQSSVTDIIIQNCELGITETTQFIDLSFIKDGQEYETAVTLRTTHEEQTDIHHQEVNFANDDLPALTDDEQEVIFEVVRNYEPSAAPASQAPMAMIKIDFPLLRQQKEVLFCLIKDYNPVTDRQEKELQALEGILSLLDGIQDATVEQGIFTEKEVFGEQKD